MSSVNILIDVPPDSADAGYFRAALARFDGRVTLTFAPGEMAADGADFASALPDGTVDEIYSYQLVALGARSTRAADTALRRSGSPRVDGTARMAGISKVAVTSGFTALKTARYFTPGRKGKRG